MPRRLRRRLIYWPREYSRRWRARRLRPRQKRRVKVRTTRSNPYLPVAPHWLLQAPPAHKPGERFYSDITYIPTHEGWLYAAATLDSNELLLGDKIRLRGLLLGKQHIQLLFELVVVNGFVELLTRLHDINDVPLSPIPPDC